MTTRDQRINGAQIHPSTYADLERRVQLARGMVSESLRQLQMTALPETLAGLAAAAEQCNESIQILAGVMRARGDSWGAIAVELGITKQAAQQRFTATRATPAGPASRPLF